MSDPWACERPLIVCDKFDECDLPSTCCLAVSPVSALAPLIFGADFFRELKIPSSPYIFHPFAFPSPTKSSDDVLAFSFAINNNVL